MQRREMKPSGVKQSEAKGRIEAHHKVVTTSSPVTACQNAGASHQVTSHYATSARSCKVLYSQCVNFLARRERPRLQFCPRFALVGAPAGAVCRRGLTELGIKPPQDPVHGKFRSKHADHSLACELDRL